MDNYPQINLKRVIKGADFGTFYKVAKARPEIFDVLTAYEFNNEQTKTSICHLGVHQEQKDQFCLS